MSDPQLEAPGATHTYIARAWYRDTATWFNLVSFCAVLLQETTFQQAIPERYHALMLAAITALNLWIRFQSSTRPVALSPGQPREVASIPPAAPPNGGSVSDATRRGLLAVLLTALVLPGCASSGTKAPETTVLQVGTQVLTAAATLQQQINADVQNGSLPVATADRLVIVTRQIYAKSGDLETAVKIYHAASTAPDKLAKGASVQALITDLSGLMAQFLKTALPPGIVQQISALAANVLAAIGTVQLQLAQGLGR